MHPNTKPQFIRHYPQAEGYIKSKSQPGVYNAPMQSQVGDKTLAFSY